MATPRKSTPSRTTRQPEKGRTTAKRAASPGASQNGQRPSPPQSLRNVALMAARELAQLIGHDPEGIVAVEKRDEGWLVQVEVVEAHRIPATTDILAVYEVEVDADGGVTGYRRKDRYVRGRVQE
ncbi:gas vesicle protein [Kribbella sp. VKM Ac-2566]|uniref:gas vesicle protein GvpO n=1 Tax=Kribbella sp. VKM Ac-2566 TaxID=2512218 RepID=UPI0010623CE6|nr:gas vesicle protein [Kribbella sp. VKM Ac-2566]TDW98612.1 gas vesicle protein GvpO [Kribbella sp. VKM Ac-2566]